MKFEQLLKLKKWEEEDLQQQLMLLKDGLKMEMARMITIKNALSEAMDSLRDFFEQKMPSIDDLKDYNDYIEAEKHKAKKLEEVIEEKQAKVDSKKTELENVLKERKLLEILEKKEALASHKKSEKQEQTRLDEMAQRSYIQEKQKINYEI